MPSFFNLGLTRFMNTTRFVHWQNGDRWIDYRTQGETIQELQDHLRDLYLDLTSGNIPGIRKVAELSLG